MVFIIILFIVFIMNLNKKRINIEANGRNEDNTWNYLVQKTRSGMADKYFMYVEETYENIVKYCAHYFCHPEQLV